VWKWGGSASPFEGGEMKILEARQGVMYGTKLAA